MLRIVGGEFKNRALKSQKSLSVRPTSSAMRGSLFNICQDSIVGANFLDLFSGTGAMGIEALSRGALHATFIEKDKKAIANIQENISLFHVEKKSKTICSDVFRAIKHLSKDFFDIIFADPPYPLFEKYDQFLLRLLMEIYKNKIIKKGKDIFVEAPASYVKKAILEIPLTPFCEISTRRFGQSILIQLREK